MEKDNAARLEFVTKTLARLDGVNLEMLDQAAAKAYRAKVRNLISLVRDYDKKVHGDLIRAAHARNREGKYGTRPGARAMPPNREAEVRRLIANGETNAAIRTKLSVGTSAITRIRRAMESENVFTGIAASGNGQSGRVQIPQPERR